MGIYKGAFGDQPELTCSNLRRSNSSIAVVAGILAGLMLVRPVSIKAQNSAGNEFTDSPAQVLLHSLSKGNEANPSTGTGGFSLAQTRRLLAQSQTVASGVPQAAAQRTITSPATSAIGSVLAEKQPGTVRIGVVQPEAQMGQGNSGTNVADPLRAVLMRYLAGPATDVVAIAAMVPSQIEAETKQKGCDYVLYSSISQKVNSSGFGMLQKAMPLMSMIPMVGAVGGMAGVVASSAAGAAMSGAAGLTGSVKAKAEMTFQYRLTADGSSTPVLANSAKAKAKQDGEDIVTPLIEHAAEAILAQVSGRK